MRSSHPGTSSHPETMPQFAYQTYSTYFVHIYMHMWTEKECTDGSETLLPANDVA